MHSRPSQVWCVLAKFNIDEKPGAGPWFAKSLFDGVEVFTTGCCIGARTSQAEAGDQVRDILSWECDGFGLTSDMDAQHVFVLIPKSLSHTNHDRLRNNTQKSVKMYIMRYYTGTRLIDHHCIFKSCQIFLFPTSSLAVGCFEDMSPFAASNFDSPLAAQSDEAGNNSEWHFLHQFLQRSVATWKRVNHWWRLPVLLQFRWIFSADACPARCRWASPSHQGENPQPMWRLRLISLGTVALSNIPAVSKYDILIMQSGAFLPLTFCSSCILSIKSITETKSASAIHGLLSDPFCDPKFGRCQRISTQCVDVLWTQQADIDPREIEMVEAASGTRYSSTFQLWR